MGEDDWVAPAKHTVEERDPPGGGYAADMLAALSRDIRKTQPLESLRDIGGGHTYLLVHRPK